ncbi:DUF366 family protein [Methanobacterium petrolearium]|uniref:DUF366 family protein n=1 Tax=Methanobacterium petrolearium TaxID=710190 RepID=UPI001AE63565|nr:DUF366 family protein [Methanobacterium petrolearium]MBP1946801.1 hypothetical protein [Methanobacterium petrolearium]
MKQINLEPGMLYDGSQIKPMWAFQRLGLKGSSIVSWRGPMNIQPDELIDYEDVGLEIKSDEMLHFIIEHFDAQPADMRLCYHRQRILVMIVQNLLREIGIITHRKGDDLYCDGGKLSVSIASCSVSSMKIHFAMNITTQGTPENIKTAGLMECSENLDMLKVSKLSDNISKTYIDEILDIEEDISKTRVF